MDDGMCPVFISGCDSVALKILATGVAVVDVTLILVIVAARDVLITIDFVWLLDVPSPVATTVPRLSILVCPVA